MQKILKLKQCTCEVINVALQLILKYAYMLAMWTPHIVHVTYCDYSLSILQNFEYKIGTFCFLKFLKNWQSVVKICHMDNVRCPHS